MGTSGNNDSVRNKFPNFIFRVMTSTVFVPVYMLYDSCLKHELLKKKLSLIYFVRILSLNSHQQGELTSMATPLRSWVLGIQTHVLHTLSITACAFFKELSYIKHNDNIIPRNRNLIG